MILQFNERSDAAYYRVDPIPAAVNLSVSVTQNGKPTSVIVSIVDWEPLSNSWENEQRIAEQVIADLQTSEEQFARGEFHSNKEVFSMMQKEFGL